MGRKKIMIYAYTNFNLGDDLFVKILCERYPKTDFVLYAPKDYKKTFKSIKNLTVYSSDKLTFKILSLFLRIFRIDYPIRRIIATTCDGIVHIGGSIFIQKKNWKKISNGRTTIKDKPFFVLGSNFGAYYNEKYYNDYYELFKTYTDICFRDRYSYELFKDLGNVRIADDIVFQLGKKSHYSGSDYITISVIKPSYREELINCDDEYYQKVTEIIKCFVSKGYNVTLMSFCDKEEDPEAIAKIIQLLPKKIVENNISKYFYQSDIEKALEIIAHSSYVIATRFHAMILGWIYNKPVYPISYSSKINNVLDDINYSGSYVNLKNINDLTSQEVYEGIFSNFVNVDSQIKNSEIHFQKLDRYLM